MASAWIPNIFFISHSNRLQQAQLGHIEHTRSNLSIEEFVYVYVIVLLCSGKTQQYRISFALYLHVQRALFIGRQAV